MSTRQNQPGLHYVAVRTRADTRRLRATLTEERTSSTDAPGSPLVVKAILPKRLLLSKTPGPSRFIDPAVPSLGHDADGS